MNFTTFSQCCFIPLIFNTFSNDSKMLAIVYNKTPGGHCNVHSLGRVVNRICVQQGNRSVIGEKGGEVLCFTRPAILLKVCHVVCSAGE